MCVASWAEVCRPCTPDTSTRFHHHLTSYLHSIRCDVTFTLAFKKLNLLSLVLLSLAFEDPNRWNPLHGALHAMLHSGGANPWHCCVKTTDLKPPQIKCKNKCRGWQKKSPAPSLSYLSYGREKDPEKSPNRKYGFMSAIAIDVSSQNGQNI